MTILASNDFEREYTANGVSSTFAINTYSGQTITGIVFFRDTDLKVFVGQTLQILGTHYTITSAPPPPSLAGRKVNASVEFNASFIPVSGAKVQIKRFVPIAQEMSLFSNQGVPAEELELQLDKSTTMLQDFTRETARTLRLSESSLSSVDPTISTEQSGYLKYDNTTKTFLTVSDATEGVEARVDDLETNVSDLDLRVTAEEASTVALNTQVGTLNTQVGTLNTQVVDLDTRIDVLETADGLEFTEAPSPYSIAFTSANSRVVAGFSDSGVISKHSVTPHIDESIAPVSASISALDTRVDVLETAENSSFTEAPSPFSLTFTSNNSRVLTGFSDQGVISKHSVIPHIDESLAPVSARVTALESAGGGGLSAQIARAPFPFTQLDTQQKAVNLRNASQAFTNEIELSIMMGQSLSRGTDAVLYAPIRVLSDTQTRGNLMFKGGMKQRLGIEVYRGVSPLVENIVESPDTLYDANGNITNNPDGETPCSHYANTFFDLSKRSSFMLNTGEGGKRISELTVSTVYFDRSVRELQIAYNAMLSRFQRMRFGKVLWMQGESDYTQPTKVTPREYANALKFLHNTLTRTGMDITGQESAPIWLNYQTTSNQYYRANSNNTNGTTQIAEGLWLASQEQAGMYLSHSMYMLYYGDGVHLHPDSSRMCGAYFARSADWIRRTGDWKPTHIMSTARSGNDLLVTFFVPVGALQFTFGSTPKINRGFDFYGTDDTTLLTSPTAVTLENATTIRLANCPVGAFLLHYGRGRTTDVGSAGFLLPAGTRGAGGDVCDSDASMVYTCLDTTTFNGTTFPSTFTLFNFAIQQKVSVA